jgi:magnesium transporter
VDKPRGALTRHRLADSHSTFLFDKINFLMNATVGFININQNKIIKIFRWRARYCRRRDREHLRDELKAIPESDWRYGYVYAIGLMIASVAAPFIFFRKKGWLR